MRVERKGRLREISSHFQPLLTLCVELQFYSVMVADIGHIGEKFHEYRNVSEYWNSRLIERGSVDTFKEFSHVMVFGGVQVPDVDGNWFVAKWEGTTTVSGLYKAGPYSNGAAKSFSGSVFDIQLGAVCRSHNAGTGWH
jgi:hypothetical protein